MKFGISTFVTDEGIAPVDLGRALEERGFDALFLAEHTHIPASRESPWSEGAQLPRKYWHCHDLFVALMAAAAATSKLRIGSGICLVIERDPITTAKEVASVDQLSGGRFEFGVGAGWNREEMRNHGTDPRTRGRLMDERILAMREIWTEETAEFHGEFVDFDPIYAWPKPVQQPHPPIYIGGESERSIARVTEFGDGWLPRGGTENLGDLISEVRDKAGRRVPVTVFGAENDAAKLAGYAEAGVDRALLMLPTRPRDETLRKLDELAELTREAG